MRIWQRLFLALLGIAGLVMIVSSVSISVALQTSMLRKVELPMEQSLREVEVGIWEASHAANAYRSTGNPRYAELFQQHARDVDAHMSNYTAMTDTPTEKDLAFEFRVHWKRSKTEGARLIEIVQRKKEAEERFFRFVDQADDTIDTRIQAHLRPSDANVLDKERALREVEVSIWEAIHAGVQHGTLSQQIGREGHAQDTFADLMEKQFFDVEEHWSRYKSLATSSEELAAIREFETSWRHAVVAGRDVVSLHDHATQRFESLYETISLVDDVIDFKLQSYVQKRVNDRDRSENTARMLIFFTGLVAILGAIAICYLLARSISNPIASLMTAVHQFTRGNLNHRIHSQRNDELGELSRAFDKMADSLKKSSDQIKREATERRQAEELADETREHLEAALAQSPSGIVIADAPDGLIRLANQAAVDIRGGELSKLIGITMEQYVDRWQIYRPDGSVYPVEELPLSVAMQYGETVQDRELIIRDEDGVDHWIIANAAPIRNAEGQIISGIVIFHDVSERQQMVEQMRQLAFHDTLTGLPNRASILSSIQDAIDREDHHFALLFLDFDRFKLINDSLGHEVGDELLKHIARRLQDALRSTDELMIPARLGGDEFVVLLDKLSSPSDATAVADRLLKVLSRSYTLGGQTVYSTASIGIVTSEYCFESASEMLRDADLAMYKSKAEGKARYTVFDQVLRDDVQAQLRLENQMRDGIQRDEFGLVYQPIVSLTTGEMAGVEALLRWTHPERGVMNADAFIPIAEESGMIIPIGYQIISEACRQLAKWHGRLDDSEQPLCIHVNLSRSQLMAPDLVGVVQKAAEEYSVPPECLYLEVTESVVMSDPKSAITTLNQLNELGVKIAIDDFGTGYSSLSCIHEFPINVLKIDRDFIDNVKKNPDMGALLTAVLTLAEHLDMRVVAEGIEEIQQVTMLRSLGCDYGQGYLFAKPMPAEEFESVLGSSFAVMSSAWDATEATQSSAID